MNNHFHAGMNMPGYLPDSDIATLATFDEAKAYMIDELERSADSYDQLEQHDLANEVSGLEQDLNLDNGPDWSAQVGNLAYWIMTCTNDECEVEL